MGWLPGGCQSDPGPDGIMAAGENQLAVPLEACS